MAYSGFTKTIVDAISPEDKVRIHYDPGYPGFGVRVTPSGYKSWIVEYRPGSRGRGVSTKRMTLGSTRRLTIDQAREEARRILARAQLGGDPARDRGIDRGMPTVREFSKIFMKEHVEERLKPSTQKTYQMHFDYHINGYLGSLRINEVKKADVAAMHRNIARGENGKRREGIANRVLITLSSMFSFAFREEVLTAGTNPVLNVQRYRESFVVHYLNVDEVARIGAALAEGETTGLPFDPNNLRSEKYRENDPRRWKLDPLRVAAIRLLLLTGARKGEILPLEWKHVDFARELIVLPDSKTGTKEIVLNAGAVECLQNLPRIGPYVFPSANPAKPLTEVGKTWKAALRHAGVSSARLHDLRHTHASIGVNSGLSLPLIGAILGHSSTTTTARYSHLEKNPIRRASELIGSALIAALHQKREQ